MGAGLDVDHGSNLLKLLGRLDMGTGSGVIKAIGGLDSSTGRNLLSILSDLDASDGSRVLPMVGGAANGVVSTDGVTDSANILKVLHDSGVGSSAAPNVYV